MDDVFGGWDGVFRTVAAGGMAYIALVILLRVSGKCTLSKMNAFDLVVTVALGSSLATVLLSKSVALVEGITAFALLMVLQFLITKLSVKSGRFQGLAKSEPRVLFRDGRFLTDAMRAERVTREELFAAVRAEGIARVEDVGAVILETDGTFSVLPRSERPATVLTTTSNVSP